MSAFVGMPDELIGAVEMSKSGDRNAAVYALGIVRDGVITGEGPTTRGRIHFSRALDAQDVAWCARILTAMAVPDQPVSRAEAEALFEINAAATERSDNGQFDDLLAKAIVHHAASASGLPAWRVLRQPARRVAQWRAQYYSDECVLILCNNDFRATAIGAKRSVATKLCMLRVRTIALRRHDRERPIPCLKVTSFLSPLRLWSRHLGPEN